MNKLEGFLTFKSISLPTVEWREYRPVAVLDGDKLWTVRTAVFEGDDYNLPRKVGVDSIAATEFAGKIYSQLNGNGMVIYYPFFVASLSGTVCVSADNTLIECVNGDLWNLVTYGKPDYSSSFSLSGELIDGRGNNPFEVEQLSRLLDYAKRLRANFRGQIAEGLSVYAEWSFAYNCDLNKRPDGEEYLVFYELRIIK